MKFIREIKQIIWDWNGTLVDDTQLCVNLINDILDQRALPTMTIDRYRETFDFPVIDYYRRIGFDFEKEPFEILSKEFIGGYIRSRRGLRLQKGAEEALQFFKTRKLPQCILSASQLCALKETLDEHGITHFFKSVLGLDHHYADGKLHLGKTWLQNNHTHREQVLFIGDTLHDLEVANEMGVHCLLVAGGHHSKARLTEKHAYVLESLDELTALFCQ